MNYAQTPRFTPFNSKPFIIMGQSYKLAWPRTKKKLASICHAITDPPVTKIRLWASFGV